MIDIKLTKFNNFRWNAALVHVKKTERMEVSERGARETYQRKAKTNDLAWNVILYWWTNMVMYVRERETPFQHYPKSNVIKKTAQLVKRCDYNDCAMIIILILVSVSITKAPRSTSMHMTWVKIKHIDRLRLLQQNICGHSSFHSITLINACLIKLKLIAQWVQLFVACYRYWCPFFFLLFLSLFPRLPHSIVTIYSFSASSVSPPPSVLRCSFNSD